MWIEMPRKTSTCGKPTGHPPCEDVDWNADRTNTVRPELCHPPCEDVDWNLFWRLPSTAYFGHPPCEDVDWNLHPSSMRSWACKSSSVWGCGLKSVSPERKRIYFKSSSVWGCGLKYEFLKMLYTQATVILRVRMWIEICRRRDKTEEHRRHPPCEDVDWNHTCHKSPPLQVSHPPCEDVDWNHRPRVDIKLFIWSSSVWGCGLKLAQVNSGNNSLAGHPPCEDVDWNATQ